MFNWYFSKNICLVKENIYIYILRNKHMHTRIRKRKKSSNIKTHYKFYSKVIITFKGVEKWKKKILVLNNIKPTKCNFFFFIHKCYFMDLKIINIFWLGLLEFIFGSTIVFVASPLPPSLPSTHQKRGRGGGGVGNYWGRTTK